MHFRAGCILILLIHTFFGDAARSRGCDGTSTKNLNAIIDDHVTRMMALRHRDWGWNVNPEAILSLQLAKPQSFFARNEAITAMEKEFQNETRTSLGKLAFYAMAASSVCRDPRNFTGVDLLKRIQENFSSIYRRNDSLINWYEYGLVMQALCVHNVAVDWRGLRKLLRYQVNKKSFGRTIPADSAAQVLIALQCLNGQKASYSNLIQRKVQQAIKDVSKSIKKKVTHYTDYVWIGNKFSTPLALTALKLVNRSFNERKERKIWLSMLSCDPEEDAETFVSHKLVSLTNSSVLDLRNWMCLDVTDLIPQGYSPSGPMQQTQSCPDSISQDDPFYSIFAVKINVSFTINDGSSNTSLLVSGASKDDSLLQVMVLAKCKHGFSFGTVPTAYGLSLVSINGRMANSELREYWSLIDAKTGIPLSAGIEHFQPSNNDHIHFTIKTY